MPPLIQVVQYDHNGGKVLATVDTRDNALAFIIQLIQGGHYDLVDNPGAGVFICYYDGSPARLYFIYDGQPWNKPADRNEMFANQIKRNYTEWIESKDVVKE